MAVHALQKGKPLEKSTGAIELFAMQSPACPSGEPHLQSVRTGRQDGPVSANHRSTSWAAPCERYWSTVIADFRRSGLTQAEFCRRRHVSIHSFRTHLYSPRHRLPAPGAAAILSTPPLSTPARSATPSFLPVHVRPRRRSLLPTRTFPGLLPHSNSSSATSTSFGFPSASIR